MGSTALSLVLVLCLSFLTPGVWAKDPPADPYVWLEEIQGEKALAWVGAQNALSHAELSKHPAFAEIEAHTLAVLEAARCTKGRSTCSSTLRLHSTR